MESEMLITSHQSRTRERVLSAVGPVLWIAMSYVDPGKWAASVEGGARFGFDLALLLLIVNFTAILCQYLSALIAIATGRNLSQICRQEYDDMTCTLLGIQAEISMIVLDITMVLGTAYGLNAVFGIDLFNCVFLTGFDAILFPFFNSLLENTQAKTISISLACFILLTYFSGALICQPESSLSLSAFGILTKLTGENAYALMSILGANIMPHNFYLHSSIVQHDQGKMNVTKGALCRDVFFATFCIFSTIFLVNCLLMNLAANVFYSTGLTSLTLQDALSLLDQGFRSSIASVPLIFIVFFSNQLVAITWSLDKEVIAHDFFGLEIPSWLHRATIRIIAIIPALCCVWNSGPEGIFQFLIFAQVLVALLLPSSVIPLFRVASSQSIMGAYKISHMVELLALLIFVGMLGLNIFFVIELVFGSSDWVTSLKWDIGSNVPISYIILLIAAFTSLRFMVWLATTPLKSASLGVDSQALKWDKRDVVTVSSSIEGDAGKITQGQYQLEKFVDKLDSGSSSERNNPTGPDRNSPEIILDSGTNHHLSRIPEIKSEVLGLKPTVDREPFAAISGNFVPDLKKVNRSESLNNSTLSIESKGVVEETLKVDGEMQKEKSEEHQVWEPEELTKDVLESSLPLTSEGLGSFRSLGGKSDDLGSGSGSLSRLVGLGRAARRQLTAILDEFWGQLFDYHGQVIQEAKAKKLNVLLGIETKLDSRLSSSNKVESICKESNGYFPSANGRGPDQLRTNFYNGSVQHLGKSNPGSSLGARLGSSMRSNYLQLSDPYVQSSSYSVNDCSERRYHSVRVSSSSDGRDQQPATIHGYNMASYLIRVPKEKASDYQSGQLESLTQAPIASINSRSIDAYSRTLGQKSQTGLRTPPGFHNIPTLRNSSLRSERSFLDPGSPKPINYCNNQSNEKKFHSLPDVSGIYIPLRSSLSESSSQWDKTLVHGQFIGRPGNGTLVGSASGFNEHSPSKVSRDAFSSQFSSNSGVGSQWYPQSHEQFGVADKTLKTQEASSNMDMEAKLLKSFRSCILKLLKLEGSDWLFRQNDGADEDIIDRVAARERFIYEVETMNAEKKLGSAMQTDELDHSRFMSIPNCGDGCVWRVDIIISFGVWCIHKILELSLVESRPELWGKYTYVLNRLQGTIDPAFSEPRSLSAPCFCLQLPSGYQQKSSLPIPNSSLPPPPKLGRGKFTSAAMLLDMINDIEIAISCRKGRSGTAAGDVAFPEGKKNLVPVLKRYKRRLANKPVASQDAGPKGACEHPLS